MAKTQLIVALDVGNLNDAMSLVERIGGAVSYYKVGKELFVGEGPVVIRALKEAGKKVFLDLKFHDIPNTVAGAIRSALNLGVDMVNVHCLGGRAMLEAAVKSGADHAHRAMIVGVTILTSMNEESLKEVGLNQSPAEAVKRLALLSRQCGLDGVVCSAHEAGMIRELCGTGFARVVPGIRPSGSALGDQKRVMTPADAARLGIEYIVVGRPITRAPEPDVAARAILDEIEGAVIE